MTENKWIEVESGIYQKSSGGGNKPKDLRSLTVRDSGDFFEVVDPGWDHADERRSLIEIPTGSIAIVKGENPSQVQGPLRILAPDHTYIAIFHLGQHVRKARALEIIRSDRGMFTAFQSFEDGQPCFFEINGTLARISPEAPMLCTGPNPKRLTALDSLSKHPFYEELSAATSPCLELAGASEYLTRFDVPSGHNGHVNLQHKDGVVDRIIPAGAYILFRPAGRWCSTLIDEIPLRVTVAVPQGADSSSPAYLATLKFEFKKPTTYLKRYGSSALGPTRMFAPELLRTVKFPHWKPVDDAERDANLKTLQEAMNLDYIELISLDIFLWDCNDDTSKRQSESSPQAADESPQVLTKNTGPAESGDGT